MKSECYLIFTRKGIKRMSKRYPGKLLSGERACVIKIEVPDKYFDQPPAPKVLVVLEESKIIEPDVKVEQG